MTRPKTLKFAIEKTNLIEYMISQLPKLYFGDEIKYQTVHVDYDDQKKREQILNIDIFVTKILKTYLKAIDYADIPRNRSLI